MLIAGNMYICNMYIYKMYNACIYEQYCILPRKAAIKEDNERAFCSLNN